MIVVDSSAVIAILFDEPEGTACTRALEHASARLMSAVNYVETGTVLAGRLRAGNRAKAMEVLDDFLAVLGIEIAPLDDAMARTALSARLVFGKGFGTRGGLKFGDCFAYALAKRQSVPLLSVGDDFGLTDSPRLSDHPTKERPRHDRRRPYSVVPRPASVSSIGKMRAVSDSSNGRIKVVRS